VSNVTKRGGVPPIVVVLVVVAFLISAALVSWYIISIHSKASKQPLIVLEPGVYADGQTVFFTLRNDGTETADLTSVYVRVAGAGEALASCEITNLQPGQSTRCSATLTSAPTDGSEGVIRTPYVNLKFIVDVLQSG